MQAFVTDAYEQYGRPSQNRSGWSRHHGAAVILDLLLWGFPYLLLSGFGYLETYWF
jgi:hypothetical protein